MQAVPAFLYRRRKISGKIWRGRVLHKLNIALDGPAGAGKSTIARLVAKRLGYIYVDTGAMYRAVTWNALQEGLDPERTREIADMARRLRIELIPEEQGQQVLVNGRDVTDELRSVQVNQHVSQISQIPQVRELLVEKQKQMAAGKGVVMDGRDIGTHVLPDAEVKVFLTASVRERAERRFKEMLQSGQEISLEQLEKDISLRDKMDEQREISPLVQAKDAVLLDCTSLSIDEVVDAVMKLCTAKVNGGV
jgi:cytidylate kinase